MYKYVCKYLNVKRLSKRSKKNIEIYITKRKTVMYLVLLALHPSLICVSINFRHTCVLLTKMLFQILKLFNGCVSSSCHDFSWKVHAMSGVKPEMWCLNDHHTWFFNVIINFYHYFSYVACWHARPATTEQHHHLICVLLQLPGEFSQLALILARSVLCCDHEGAAKCI